MSMSGWWPAFSASSPTLFTKAREATKSLNAKVRMSSPDSTVQPGTPVRRLATSADESGDMRLDLLGSGTAAGNDSNICLPLPRRKHGWRVRFCAGQGRRGERYNSRQATRAQRENRDDDPGRRSKLLWQ